MDNHYAVTDRGIPVRPAGCPACGSITQTVLEAIDLGEQHRFYAPQDPARQAALTRAANRSASHYAMQRCQGCGLEWADPMRAPDFEWYDLAYSTLSLYPGSRWEFDVVTAQCRTSDRVFDIGCGDGAFLQQCRQKGLHATGADFASGPVNTCRRQGLEVELIDLQGGSPRGQVPDATVVTAFQVLEHLADPGHLFEFAASVSTADAGLWVAIPSDRRPSRVLGERDYLDQPPHHLTRWNADALRSVGDRHGWLLDSVCYEPLPRSTALWWIATRSDAYKRAVGGAAGQRRSTERLVRWAQYPAAWFRRATRFRDVAGFSMLGRFRKRPALPA